ncbi:hypothetical protein ATSB10_20720 [Dyella thiooxydans]|uniref:Uncharacterized protein n=1 Tax=Dyella thiooxydans TaxID=445710 RepID=A0A160N153_9GAMM|nr:hypothetical protein ATSB10_20720 [Dyella thiooxydans]
MEHGVYICVDSSSRHLLLSLATGGLEDLATRNFMVARKWAISGIAGIEEVFSLTFGGA